MMGSFEAILVEEVALSVLVLSVEEVEFVAEVEALSVEVQVPVAEVALVAETAAAAQQVVVQISQLVVVVELCHMVAALCQ